MYNGIINIYKEAGFTSHDVVAKLPGYIKAKENRAYRHAGPGGGRRAPGLSRQGNKGLRSADG